MFHILNLKTHSWKGEKKQHSYAALTCKINENKWVNFEWGERGSKTKHPILILNYEYKHPHFTLTHSSLVSISNAHHKKTSSRLVIHIQYLQQIFMGKISRHITFDAWEREKEMMFYVTTPLTVYLSWFHTLLVERACQEERWQDQKTTCSAIS